MAARIPGLLALRKSIYSTEFRDLIREISGCGPLSDKVDMSCNIYAQGGHLLCHDDVIGTRRISYILYFAEPGARAHACLCTLSHTAPPASTKLLHGHLGFRIRFSHDLRTILQMRAGRPRTAAPWSSTPWWRRASRRWRRRYSCSRSGTAWPSLPCSRANLSTPCRRASARLRRPNTAASHRRSRADGSAAASDS